jgi:hypothetical protein
MPDEYRFDAAVEQALGLRHLRPASGRSLEEELVAALNKLGAKAGTVLMITIRHRAGKEGTP